MDDNLVEQVKSKSTRELIEIAVNFFMQGGLLVTAANDELAFRGVALSDEEQQKIDTFKNKRKQDAITSVGVNKTWHKQGRKWDIEKNIVTDFSAPQLYSRRVILIFSLLFSVLFGGILLAINLKTVNNKKAILPVLFFSVAFFAFILCILYLFPDISRLFTVPLNILGAYILQKSFWKDYINKDFLYRTKPFWEPLIIDILIFILAVV